MSERSLRAYDSALWELEQAHGLPVGLLGSVRQVESGGNPAAVSPKGAIGPYQFMPGTAQEYGGNPRDPQQSADMAARYYKDLLSKYAGNVDHALAAYNWGPGNLDKQGLARMPRETQDYITKVRAHMAAPNVIDQAEQAIYGRGGTPPPGSSASAPASPQSWNVDSAEEAIYGKSAGKAAGQQPSAYDSVTVDPATGNAKMTIDITRAAGDTPPPPGTSSKYPGLGAFGELGEELVDMGKTALATGISTATSLGGAALGALTSPVTGPIGPVAGEMAGSLAGRKINVALGLEEKGPSVNLPFAGQTNIGDLAATVLPGALRLPGAAARGGRALLEKSPPGQLLRRTEAQGALEASREAGEAALTQTKTAIDHEIATSQARLQTELDQFQNMREQTQNLLHGYTTDIQQAQQAGKAVQSSELAAVRDRAKAHLAAIDRTALETQQAHQAHLDALHDAQTRELATARQQAVGTRQRAVTNAREYVQQLPVPTEETVKELYDAVGTYHFTMPTTLLRDAQEQLGQTVSTVKKFFPRAGMGETERLAAMGSGTVPAATREAGQELQQFIRSHGGMKLSGEELQGELAAVIAPKDTGTTGLLNNRSGQSLQTMAERAHEAGFLDTPDKTALLDALSRSHGGHPVYNVSTERMVDELGDFFDRASGQAPTVPGEISFQEARSLLKWLGQRIGSLQRATTPDAGEQLGAAKLLYGKVQQTLDGAAKDLHIPTEARAALQEANAAYKVQATVETLGDTIERFITDGKFNASGMLDYLRKNKEGGFLRDRLFQIGQLDNVERFLFEVNRDIKTAASQVGSTRSRFQQETTAARRTLRDAPEAFREQRAGIQTTMAGEEAAIAARGAEQAGALQAEAQGVEESLRHAPQQFQFATDQLKRQHDDFAARLTGRYQQQKTALQDRLAAQEADIPPKPWVPPLYAGGGGFIAALYYHSPIGQIVGAGVLLARGLMTPPGQRWVAKQLIQNRGTVDPSFVERLGNTYAREYLRHQTAAPKTPVPSPAPGPQQ